MYAGTTVNWHEVLKSQSTTSATNESLPLFLAAFSADKGTEDITDLTLDDFKAMYGSNADFFKYGQPIIQAHAILEAGGRILGKRIVAEDSKLANIIITATITNVNDKPVIKYAASTIATAKTYNDVVTGAASLKTDSVFPLFIICDNGRGASNKNVKIVANYDSSKTLDFVMYNLSDIEDSTTIETVKFSVNPDATSYSGGIYKNMALHKSTSTQFNAEYYKTGWDAYITKLAELTGYTVDDLYALDVLFAKSKKGVALTAYSIDSTGLDLSATYGIALQSGDNGAFGNNPWVDGVATDSWNTQAVAFFDGTFSDEIFDLDQHKIDYCVDANYADIVKKAIADLAVFREDFYFLRDMGTTLNSLAEIQYKVNGEEWTKSAFVGDYASHYDIIDPFSKKQITVSMTYGMSDKLVSHFSTNIAAPLAGEFNGFVITNFIDGTLNFIPRVTPSVDQKTALDDIHVNYLNYSSTGALAVQSTYTSQDHWGPLTYASNVILTQQCIKAIRRYTPKIRFMLMDGSDFSKYKQLIQDNVIAYYTGYFASVTLEYTPDEDQSANKIFNASIKCYYKDFPQAEVFDVFAIEGSATSES